MSWLSLVAIGGGILSIAWLIEHRERKADKLERERVRAGYRPLPQYAWDEDADAEFEPPTPEEWTLHVDTALAIYACVDDPEEMEQWHNTHSAIMELSVTPYRSPTF